MPWWIKFESEEMPYPRADGPWATEAEAQAALDVLEAEPEVTEQLTLVEADLGYPHTFKHPIGKMANADGQDNIVYSDGSVEPIV